MRPSSILYYPPAEKICRNRDIIICNLNPASVAFTEDLPAVAGAG